MKKWKIPVTWEVCGYVYVDADTLVEAMETARYCKRTEGNSYKRAR